MKACATRAGTLLSVGDNSRAGTVGVFLTTSLCGFAFRTCSHLHPAPTQDFTVQERFHSPGYRTKRRKSE